MECCLLGGEEITGEVLSAGAEWIPLPTHEGMKRTGRMFKTLQELNVCARSHELFMDWNPTCPGQADSAAVFPPTSTHPAALNMRSNTVTYCSSASR